MKPKKIEDIFESDLFKKMEAEDEKALNEAGWTRKEIDQIANFIIHMKPLTKEEIKAYKEFSKLCKKLEQMEIKQAKVIKIN